MKNYDIISIKENNLELLSELIYNLGSSKNTFRYLKKEK